MRIPQIVLGLGLVVLVVLLLTPQRHPPAYNAASEVTLQGVVEDVKNFYCPISGDDGTHLILATSRGKVQVHVAPSRFLSGSRVQFFRGDEVEVVGTPIVFQGNQALIARTIVRGNQTVALRTAQGKPLWVE
jgi:hypothetical protein